MAHPPLGSARTWCRQPGAAASRDGWRQATLGGEAGGRARIGKGRRQTRLASATFHASPGGYRPRLTPATACGSRVTRRAEAPSVTLTEGANSTAAATPLQLAFVAAARRGTLTGYGPCEQNWRSFPQLARVPACPATRHSWPATRRDSEGRDRNAKCVKEEHGASEDTELSTLGRSGATSRQEIERLDGRLQDGIL
jgi:hypothetical protein